MFGLGFQELLIILVIVLFLFGGKKLPEIAGGLGKAVREFKRATAEPETHDAPDHQIPPASATDETPHHGAHTKG
jgi:sec-independent protein translocase protein TatA